VKQLLDRGFSVRAGVRDEGRAKQLFQSSGLATSERLSLAVCDVTAGASTLQAALGDSTAVVCCLGAPESEARDWTKPRAIDGDGTVALIAAAAAKGVRHFVLVSSLGTGRFGWPASILNLFWNVLEHKRRAELALVASGLRFTILRPGGMERPTDEYEKTHGTVLYGEDTKFGGQVSRLQVAQLAAECLLSPTESADKILEVIAEENVPLRPLARQMLALPPIVAGSHAQRFAFVQSPTARFLDAMAFGGSMPETVNGRVAMLAAPAILWGEAEGLGGVREQVLAAASHAWPELVAGAVILASLPPVLRRVSATDAQLGLFSAGAEKANGRLAMLGLVGAAWLEAVRGSTVWEHPWPI
jgi:uncharacterized protein YbjT (DUF2867 family)